MDYESRNFRNMRRKQVKFSFKTPHMRNHTSSSQSCNTSDVPETIFLYIYVHPIIVSYYFKWFYGYMRVSYFMIFFLIYLLCMCIDHVVFPHTFDLI